MCGITAVYTYDGLSPQSSIDRFTDALGHRGPDGRGTYVDGNVALGHRRLSILDLSDAGACPMSYTCPDGRRLVITYNGEVYNFIELKAQLEGRGYRFSSSTDTEVVLAAYAEWGEDFQFRLNGMWALVIYDTGSREMFISRDRFGIKPCYFHIDNKRFAVASELKAFLALEGARMSFNDAIVPELLQRCRYDGHSPNTACSEVFSLLAGHCARVYPDGRLNIRRWWDTSEHIPSVPTSYSKQVEEYKNLFIDSVRIRMRSDVPLATCLSGGIDSTAVSSTMRYVANALSGDQRRISRDWQNTFVATFPGSFIDEREYAECVVKHIGACPHYLDGSAQPKLMDLLASVVCLDEPSGGVVLPVWQIYRMLRDRQTKVSLDGHGSDELLGGYSWYLETPVRDLSQLLYSDFHFALLPTILRNYDRCSMAHGIEVRMPFMDYRLVTFTCGLDSYSRVGGGFTKRILRDAMADIMPDLIRERQGKIGFNAPLINWYNSGLAEFLIKIVNHDLFLENDPHQRDALRKEVLEKTLSRSWKKVDWPLAFKITIHMNLLLWRLHFIERERDYADLFSSVQSSGPLGSCVSSGQESAKQVSKVSLTFNAKGLPLDGWQVGILNDISKAQLEAPLECSMRYLGISLQDWLPSSILKNMVEHEMSSSVDRSIRVGLVLGELPDFYTSFDVILAPTSVRPIAGFNGIWKTFCDSDEIVRALKSLIEGSTEIPMRPQFSALSDVGSMLA